MKFGYLIFATDNSTIDYLNLCYTLAMTIKINQKPGYDKVALVIDDKDKLHNIKSPWVFDEVIELKDTNGWNGRSYMYDISPWENTICLDADMLLLRDISHWVDYFIKNSDLYICNRVFTYKDELALGDYYRKTFTANDLPNAYSMFTFFKKNSEKVKQFFHLQKIIIENPVEFSNLFLTIEKPPVVGTDEAFGLALKLLDIQDAACYDLEFLKIIHLKGMMQNWDLPSYTVSDRVGLYLDRTAKLKIGNFYINDVIHYVEKNFITDEVISIFEEILWKKK